MTLSKATALCDIKVKEVDAIMEIILKNLAGIDANVVKEILLAYRDYEAKAEREVIK